MQMNDVNECVEETSGIAATEQNDDNRATQIDTVIDDPSIQVLKEEENYVVSSDDEKSDSQVDSLDGSQTPADSTESDAKIEANAFEEELRGKNLSEQVKFLKEQGLTFRTISERLNVPITNCHTAIKKLRLPTEYWERIKAEVRIKKRQQEMVANELTNGHQGFANTNSASSRKRHHEELQQDFGRELDLTSPSKMPNSLVASLANSEIHSFQPTTPNINENMPLSGRKHLTLEDGKVVQYWRDKGLTLQKIAEKLQMPMSSCYRAMKRYQVSQKASMIMTNDKTPTSSSSTCTSTANIITSTTTTPIDSLIDIDNRTITKSTSELLLGMVNASMNNLPSSSNGNLSLNTSERVNNTSLSSVSNIESSISELLAEERRRKPKQSPYWAFILPSSRPNIYQCILCGLEMQCPSAWNVSQHMKMRHPDIRQEIKNSEAQKKIKTPKEDPEISSNLFIAASHSRTSSNSHSPVPVSQETNYVLQTIKEKLEWAALKMTSSTDTEEIISLMKVMSSGLTLLKQFSPQQ
ncbi:unnamed protein product [Anisakis simplex]|uniref:BED-type domain-containing protein n=1 Tax=Anisakis simplex TaxID=6269 RepID=A0A0M3K4Q8_ANISI|nr:unnamed protein product [Anisakis simplex]